MSLPGHHRSQAARTRRTDGSRSPPGSLSSNRSRSEAERPNGLDAGVSMRDTQDFAPHADPKTTRRYDRSRHATYASAHYFAGGN
jgi:hypothetical protein